MTRSKQQLGQFMTTNYKYIMDSMVVPDVSRVDEPFAGKKDMLGILERHTPTVCYDIDPQAPDIIQRDTLADPPEYNYVITNPPYLARNKAHDKTLYDKYQTNDLYKCFVISLIDSAATGGIIIIPLNFWSSIRKQDVDLRRKFLQRFVVERVNVFEERVFDDTSYAVCCIQFVSGSSDNIPFYIYPEKRRFNFTLDRANNYSIGGEIYKLCTSRRIKVGRLTSKNEATASATYIKLYALDANSKNRIRLEIGARHVDRTARHTERSFATLTIEPHISIAMQALLALEFNIFLESYRRQYNSMFLTNYRESSDIARKRISFSLVYRIVNHLLTTHPVLQRASLRSP